jgi:hypothetical protein
VSLLKGLNSNGMKSLRFGFALLMFFACEEQEIVSSENIEARKFSNLTWELIELRDLSGQWRTVTAQEKHFITFVNDSLIEYADAQQTCNGIYRFETLENSTPADRLILKASCMVPAPQLWWEHAIEEKSENEVITYPQMVPTAYMTYTWYKYRVHSGQQ